MGNLKSKWRERYYQEEWTKRVDISILSQLEAEAANFQERLTSVTDDDLRRQFQYLADRFTYLAAIAAGKMSDFDLSKVAMPEDAEAKIPDLRPPAKHLRRPIP
jgi:hypothetical protein